MGKTRGIFKKSRDIKGTLHAKMGKIRQRWYGLKRNRRHYEEVARIHRRTVQKRS